MIPRHIYEQSTRPGNPRPDASPYQRSLKLVATPKASRFRIGERVKGRLEFPQAQLRADHQFLVAYYQVIRRGSMVHPIPRARMLLTAVHFDGNGHCPFGFEERIDGVPYDDGQLRVDYELSIVMSSTTKDAHRLAHHDLQLSIRNKEATYLMQSATLPLVGTQHDTHLMKLAGIVVTLATVLLFRETAATVAVLVAALPVIAYFILRLQRQRLFGKASLEIGPGTDTDWTVTLHTQQREALVDSLLHLSVRYVYETTDKDGNPRPNHRTLYYQTTDLIDAEIIDITPGSVSFILPKPNQVLPSSGVHERIGVEWKLIFEHRPAYWSTIRREWTVRVGLGPQ